MLDIKLFRTEPELIKENIRKKFQDEKLPLVDEVVEMDKEYRATKTKADEYRAKRNKLSNPALLEIKLTNLVAADSYQLVAERIEHFGKELG